MVWNGSKKNISDLDRSHIYFKIFSLLKHKDGRKLLHFYYFKTHMDINKATLLKQIHMLIKNVIIHKEKNDFTKLLYIYIYMSEYLPGCCILLSGWAHSLKTTTQTGVCLCLWAAPQPWVTWRWFFPHHMPALLGHLLLALSETASTNLIRLYHGSTED